MPEKDKSKKDARITIRFTGAQAADLKAAAQKRDRSINWLARHIISTWLERRRSK